MTLREQLTRLHELIGEDVFTDAPECRERVAEIHLLRDSIEQAAALCAPSLGPLDKDGMMTCPQCGRTATPNLVETGYDVTHEFRGLDANTGVVYALGFGRLAAVSEEGDEEYYLCCHHCGHREPFPDDLVIDWEGSPE